MAVKYKVSALFGEVINELMGWTFEPWHYSSQRSEINEEGVEVFLDRYPESEEDWNNGMCFMDRDTATEIPRENWPVTYEQFVTAYAAKVAEVPIRFLRAERNRKLAATDWMSSGDRTMTQEEIDYRQALRDITDPAITPDPENPTWPTPPASATGRYGPNDVVINRPQLFPVPCSNEIV